MATTITENNFLPLNPQKHGTEIITLAIGKGGRRQTFMMHKEVLCKASSFFNRTLENGFREAIEAKITLADQDPIAFGVLYQYLYSGNVHKADFYTQERIPDDLLWLRTFKLADATMLQPLIHIAYDRLREAFNPKSLQAPTVVFLRELYDQEYPQEELAEYVVAHCAHCIHAGGLRPGWETWTKLIDSSAPFGVDVARQLVKLCAQDYNSGGHPQNDRHFDKEKMFPPRFEMENMLLETTQPVEGASGGEGEVAESENRDGGRDLSG